MPRSAGDFVNFIAGHFRPIEAICRQRARFTSDDEIAAFLRAFESEDKSLSRLIGRMREVGVLVELAGEWTLPPFLVEFIENVSQRHALASPRVIQSWVETLDHHVTELSTKIDAASSALSSIDADGTKFLLREIADVFQTIVRTVQDNCDRIASEVAEYRTIEDSGRLRARLNRLIQLHDDYLEPIIRIVDVGGDFHAVTGKVANCCTRLSVMADAITASVGEEARIIQREVVWLRRVVVRRAEEARRELSPLCEAAVRESKIAVGVNRALESIRLDQWPSLALEGQFPIVDDRDGTLFSDLAVQRYLKLADTAESAQPPRVTTTEQKPLRLGLTPEDVAERLEPIEAVDDLLAWILETSDEVDLNHAVRLFHSVIESRSDRAKHTEFRKEYTRHGFAVEATCWTWKGPPHGDSRPTSPADRPPRATRRRIPRP